MDHENYLLLCLSKWVHIKNSYFIHISLFINKNTNQIRCFQMYTVGFQNILYYIYNKLGLNLKEMLKF